MPRKSPVRPAAEIVRPPDHASGPTDPAITWGYARISTDEQTTQPQTLALSAAGILPEHLVCEQISGAIAARRRPALSGLLDVLRPGDTLAVVRLDRIGRDPPDVLTLIRDLDRQGIRLRLLDMGAETGTPAGDLVVCVLAAVAGWERAVLRARTREGLEAARQRGQSLGRRRSLTPGQRQQAGELAQAGHSVREVALRLACSVTVAHRAMVEAGAANS